MSCFEMSTSNVCFTDAAGARQTLVAHYEYGKNADNATVLVSTRYTESDGITIVDTAAGVVSAGACPVYSPDVEWSRLCDVQADGTYTEFNCRSITSFNTAGEVIEPVKVDYFADDKVTVYVPTGDVKPCPDCPPAVVQGLLTSWGS